MAIFGNNPPREVATKLAANWLHLSNRGNETHSRASINSDDQVPAS